KNKKTPRKFPGRFRKRRIREAYLVFETTRSTRRSFAIAESSAFLTASRLPFESVSSLSAATPSERRYFFTAAARRSPRPRLYSEVPRQSQWPSRTRRCV